MFDVFASGSAEAVKAVCLTLSDLETTDAEGNTPFLLAVKCDRGRSLFAHHLRRGELDLVVGLVARGSDASALNIHKWNALHVASYNGGTEELGRLLIKEGVNVNAVDQSGWTPLHVVCALLFGCILTNNDELLGCFETKRGIFEDSHKEWCRY